VGTDNFAISPFWTAHQRSFRTAHCSAHHGANKPTLAFHQFNFV
jgi:hypothetical protein